MLDEVDTSRKKSSLRFLLDICRSIWWLMIAVVALSLALSTQRMLMPRIDQNLIPQHHVCCNSLLLDYERYLRMKRNVNYSGTIVSGTVVMDVEAERLSGNSPCAGKEVAKIIISDGGGAPNIARGYQDASGKSVFLAFITGTDKIGDTLGRLITTTFVLLRRVATAAFTRVSLIVPSDEGDDPKTWTSRATLDRTATFNFLQPLLSKARRLVLASFTAADASLIRQLLTAFPGDVVLALTKDQCRDSQTITLMKRAALSWLNAHELRVLVPLPDEWRNRQCDSWSRIVQRINVLRKYGVRSVVVTNGCHGALALIDNRWYRASAFDVHPVRSSSRCGDLACGTFLAAMDSGRDSRTALELGMAAAGMHLAGVRRAGWTSIERFVSTTGRRNSLPPRATIPVQVIKDVRRRLQPAALRLAYLTLGILVATLLQSSSIGGSMA